jgi:isopenicillin-N N-acyltransferase-like protein
VVQYFNFMLNQTTRPRLLPIITIKGSPYERGYQYGAQLKAPIRAFLSDNLARINLSRRREISYDEAMEAVARHAPFIEADLPLLAEEIKGLADGAGITYMEAMLLQVRREILSEGLDCTSLAGFDAEGRAFIAQNVDLPGHLSDFGLILRVVPQTAGEPELLMYTYVGLLGYLGINSFGIGVGLNMVLSGGWRPGVPPYLIIRQLLHQPDLASCLREIHRIRRASSRSIMLTDGARIINLEMTVDEQAMLEGQLLMHTNHYLCEEFRALDLINPNSSTFERLRRTGVLLGSETRPDSDALRRILSDHEGSAGSICAHSPDDPTRGETIASAILFPGDGLLYAAKGYPCRNDFQEHALSNPVRLR